MVGREAKRPSQESTMSYSTTQQPQQVAAPSSQQKPARRRTMLTEWLTTTDHKVIGNLYLVTSFVYFLLGGVLALLIRAELMTPGLQLVDNPTQYNQLFTMHGTIMLLLFATPLF